MEIRVDTSSTDAPVGIGFVYSISIASAPMAVLNSLHFLRNASNSSEKNDRAFSVTNLTGSPYRLKWLFSCLLSVLDVRLCRQSTSKIVVDGDRVESLLFNVNTSALTVFQGREGLAGILFMSGRLAHRPSNQHSCQARRRYYGRDAGMIRFLSVQSREGCREWPYDRHWVHLSFLP